jgi:hypothetical protein
MYFQYPLTSRMIDRGSWELNYSDDTRHPPGKSRCPVHSPLPVIWNPKPMRVV